MKNYILIFLLFWIWNCKTSETNTRVVYDPEDFGFSKDSLLIMSENVKKYVDNGEIPFVQKAIIKDNRLIYFESYGNSDIESGAKIKNNSISRIYSMTKPIVSVAVMILVERGIIGLEDNLKDYIPDFENLVVFDESLEFEKLKNDISISDLLSHQAGFGYGWGSNPYLDSLYAKIWSQKNNQDFVRYLSTIPLFFEPKTNWRYGVSTDVLGRVIEVASNQSLFDFLYDNIFKPLEMFDTYFQIPNDKINRFVSNYRMNELENKLEKVDDRKRTKYSNVTMHSGGGGLISTMSDYINFCLMLSNNGSFNKMNILSSESIEMMTKNQIGDTVYPWDEGVKFGYGFSVVTNDDLSRLRDSNGSFGWSGAAGTHFTIDPEKNIILILITQRMHPWSSVWRTFNDMTYNSIRNNLK